jgi:hypothetical protein
MSAVITDDIRIQSVINFYTGYFPSGGSTDNSIYMCYGKANSWPSSGGLVEDDQGFVVPVPLSGTAGELFRADMIAGQRILSDEISPVIRRVNWTIGQTYTSGTVVITAEYNVYLAESTIQNNTIPTHLSGVVNNWRFLYKISEQTFITNFVTDDWIPVYLNGNVGSLGTPVEDSVVKTKCKFIMTSVTLNTSKITLANLNDFRKIALWGSPLDLVGDYVSTSSVLASGMNIDSGTVVYVDHRLPVYREEGQIEKFRVILGF